jgi:protein-S-isoprenylcysteine O-methyltransferase Ste14
MNLHALELKIPPPLAALCIALAMWLTSRIVGPIDVPHLLRIGAALAFLVVGLGFDVAGLVSFMRARTTVNPLRPAATSALVVSGVYRFTRNPMYVGLLLVLVAWATFLANGVAYLLAPLFVLYIGRFQIVPEERMLAEKFGADFADYRARVHRWL